ncbi:MAG: glycoside hydrolase family 25 protein [Chthoniobacteraceae bacterium]
MKSRIHCLLGLLPLLLSPARAENAVVNLSHYDEMRPDFARMSGEGILAVIHEATYPKFVRDARYAERQTAAARAGLLWGAYHFADATDPERQADYFISVVGGHWRQSAQRPPGVLMVLDFELNNHYPGGTMTPVQAAKFVERIRERTGRYPGVYASEYRIKAMLSGSSTTAAVQRTLSNCWLWIANYHHTPASTHPWQRWMLWQYTGDGICDLPRSKYPINIANIRKAERNLFSGSRSGLRSFWSANAWVPKS